MTMAVFKKKVRTAEKYGYAKIGSNTYLIAYRTEKYGYEYRLEVRYPTERHIVEQHWDINEISYLVVD